MGKKGIVVALSAAWLLVLVGLILVFQTQMFCFYPTPPKKINVPLVH